MKELEARLAALKLKMNIDADRQIIRAFLETVSDTFKGFILASSSAADSKALPPSQSRAPRATKTRASRVVPSRTSLMTGCVEMATRKNDEVAFKAVGDAPRRTCRPVYFMN